MAPRKRSRASWPRSARAGPTCASSCAPTAGFARDELMEWCEENGVDFIFGLARNVRLVGAIKRELVLARRASRRSGRAERRFAVLDKLGHARGLGEAAQGRRQGRVDARIGQPALRRHLAALVGRRCPQALRGRLLRARRDGEPHQGMPVRSVRRSHQRGVDARQSTAAVVRSLRLRDDGRARRIGLAGTELARATCGTIRLKLLKIGAKPCADAPRPPEPQPNRRKSSRLARRAPTRSGPRCGHSAARISLTGRAPDRNPVEKAGLGAIQLKARLLSSDLCSVSLELPIRYL